MTSANTFLLVKGMHFSSKYAHLLNYYYYFSDVGVAVKSVVDAGTTYCFLLLCSLADAEYSVSNISFCKLFALLLLVVVIDNYNINMSYYALLALLLLVIMVQIGVFCTLLAFLLILLVCLRFMIEEKYELSSCMSVVVVDVVCC